MKGPHLSNAQFISRVRGCVARGGKSSDLHRHYLTTGRTFSSLDQMQVHIGGIIINDITPDEADERALSSWEHEIHS